MYRDMFQRCPRCATELRELHTMAACPTCDGRFVPLPVFLELANDMQPHGSSPIVALPLWPRTDSPIGCPSCGDAMAPVHLNVVLLDLCSKHGLWFDRGEMSYSLMLFSQTAEHSLQARDQMMATAWLVLDLQDRRRTSTQRFAFIHSHVLLGSASHASVQLPTAPAHAAIIYRMPGQRPLLIVDGDQQVMVNDQPVTRATLAAGDRIQIAEHSLDVVYTAPQ